MNTSLPLYLMDRVLREKWVDLPAIRERRLVSRADAQDLLDELTEAFPDLKITIEDVLQDGNKVVVRSEIAGTHRAPFRGVPARHRKMAIQVIDIHEIERGRIARTWHSEDWLTGFHQLGVLRGGERAARAARRR